MATAPRATAWAGMHFGHCTPCCSSGRGLPTALQSGPAPKTYAAGRGNGSRPPLRPEPLTELDGGDPLSLSVCDIGRSAGRATGIGVGASIFLHFEPESET